MVICDRKFGNEGWLAHRDSNRCEKSGKKRVMADRLEKRVRYNRAPNRVHDREMKSQIPKLERKRC